MEPEEILLEELNKWQEYAEEIPEDQTSAFLVGILAHRCSKAEKMSRYYKKLLEKYDRQKYLKDRGIGENSKELEDINGENPDFSAN